MINFAQLYFLRNCRDLHIRRTCGSFIYLAKLIVQRLAVFSRVFRHQSGLHLALRDPRTLCDVDITIAHPNLPKIAHLPKKD